MKLKKLVVIGMACVTLFGAVPVMASTTDSDFYAYTCAGGYEEKIGNRSKEGTTKVYTRVDSSPQERMQVRVYGYKNSSYTNKTNGGVAYVDRGVQSSISNGIYEAGFRIASMAFRTTNENYYGDISGVWSPDSKRNYTVVN